MKKILSLVLASAMVASMAVTAFAGDKYHHTGSYSVTENGVLVTKTEDTKNPVVITELKSDTTFDAWTEGTDSKGKVISKSTDYGAKIGASSYSLFAKAKDARDLAEGEGKVKIPLTGKDAYSNISDFNKDYSFNYKVKKGPVKSVTLKVDEAKYKYGEEAKGTLGSIENDSYRKVIVEIKFDKITSTDASTPYEVEVDLNDKNSDKDVKDCSIKGNIINEAYKPEFEDDYEATFEGYAPVLDFDNFKNDVAEFKFTFAEDDGDEILDVSYKGVQSGKVNFSYNFYQNSAIVNKYADVNFNFINFVAAPKIAKVANLSFYSDYDKGGVFQLNADGSIQNMGAKYNSTTKAYEFKTATLGSFFVASDAAKIITAPVSSSSTAASSSATDAKSNPKTGASDIVNVAVVMSVVSLAAAGAVAFKKASK